MAEITREEFKKIYGEKFVPILKDIEPERVETLKKAKKRAHIIGLLFLVIGSFLSYNIFIVNSDPSEIIKACISSVIFTFLISLIPSAIIYSSVTSSFRKILKNEVISEVLSAYGNLYFSKNSDAITLKEMQSCGLFPKASSKTTDDVIIGSINGSNFVISESSLTHTERSGEDSRLVTDFGGIVVKIQMNKNFSGKTVVGFKGEVAKKYGFEKVELESVDFMKSRDVFSTDQIEARYIMTTAFIERLDKLATVFIDERRAALAKTINPQEFNYLLEHGARDFKAKVVSAEFIDGFAYLFIPSLENFFEVDINKTLFDFDQYYRIYNELNSILSVVEHLNLDSKTGL